MKTLNFNCFKIASRLPLGTLASFFNTHSPLSWKNYICLKGNHIDIVLKYQTTLKEAYLFEFGCVTFVNFTSDEIRVFLQYLKSIVGNIDSNMFTKFHESHTMKINNFGRCNLWKGNSQTILFHDYIIPITSIILAKSTALYKMEVDVGNLLDKAENFIHYLKKGKLHANTKHYTVTYAKIIRFEYDGINSIRIFDRSFDGDENVHAREVYDILAEYYELHERFDVIAGKVEDLRNIIGSYSSLSHNYNEKRLLMFEIFLLCLFPLFHAAHYLVDNFSLSNVFQLLFR